MAREKFHPLTVSGVCPETDSAVCVTFEIPAALRETFRFIQGQYVALRTTIDGVELTRCYSICSGVDDGCLRIAIRRVENGAFSGYANSRLRAGDVLDVSVPEGRFHTHVSASAARHYMCICAGSGITPVLSIVKTVLAREPGSFVTLLYGNRSSNRIMFKEELGLLKNRHPARLNWLNILSREEQDADVLFGRLDNRKGADLQRRCLIDLASVDDFFLCGPEAMISEVSRGLREFGIEESRIHYELFHASSEDAGRLVERHHERARRFDRLVSDVTLKVGGRSSAFELAATGGNLLDAALDHGADVPFSCRGGVCATCKALLREGSVDMDLSHGLSAEEVGAGFILACQAHPTSRKLVVDFDAV